MQKKNKTKKKKNKVLYLMFQTKKEVVDECTVLKRKPNSEEALDLLKKLVSQVKPIITRRNWHVRYLCEFFPKNPNLLGIK
jgi:hypothetical protein